MFPGVAKHIDIHFFADVRSDLRSFPCFFFFAFLDPSRSNPSGDNIGVSLPSSTDIDNSLERPVPKGGGSATEALRGKWAFGLALDG